MTARSNEERVTASNCFRCAALTNVLEVREAELLKLKGPCRVTGCTLHYAHSGPCDCDLS